MAYSLLGSADNFATNTLNTIQLAQTYAGGEAVVVIFNHNNNPTSNLVTIVDGVNTYTKIDSIIETGGNTISWLFYCPSVAAGSVTLYATVNANTNWRAISAYRYSGLNAFKAAQTHLSQRQAAPGTGSNAVTTGNMTPISQPAMVFGFTVNATDTSAPAAGSGFTSRGAPASWTPASMGASNVEDLRITSTSAVAATFTSSIGSETYTTMGAIFTEGLPTIIQQPGSVVINAGDKAWLQAVATNSASTGSLSYQWQDNRGGSFANVIDGTGGTSQTYVTTSLATGATGRQYQCIVTDPNGSVTSSAATITVLATYNTTIAAFDPELTVRGWFG